MSDISRFIKEKSMRKKLACGYGKYIALSDLLELAKQQDSLNMKEYKMFTEPIAYHKAIVWKGLTEAILEAQGGSDG